jgi:hypothetical protein
MTCAEKGHDLRKPTVAKQTQDDRMSLVILRALFLRVHEYSHEPTTIRNRKLQRCCGRSLVVARTIVGDPDKNRRYAGVQTRRHQEGHSILHPIVGRGRRDVGDGCISDDGNWQSA